MAERTRSMRIAVAVGLLALGVVAGVSAAVARDARAYAGRIYPGVAIAGVPVGGLGAEAARAAIQPVVERRLRVTLALRLADRDAVFTHGELGLRAHPDEAVASAMALGRAGPLWRRLLTRLALARGGVDLPLRSSHDAAALRRLLLTFAGELDAQPQDAEVTVRDGAVVLVRPSRPGQTLDVEGTAARVIGAMDASSALAEAVVAVVPPEFTTEEAAELRASLATYTTRMAANPNRTHNIALAAGFIRGLILPPEEVFSYNKVVGPRTLARGFKEAPVLVDDELVPGDGGGICQVSSTLFNVALLADFKILNRTNHSRPVAYLPAGRDATAVYGALDLLFRNTSGHHILLWTEVRGSRLTITAFGTPADGKEVTIQVVDRQEIPPPTGTVTKKDPQLEAGRTVVREAQPGLRVRTYRVVTVKGEVVRRELIATSYYRPVPRTIKIGTKQTAASEPHP